MKDTRSRDFPENTTRVSRQAFRELRACGTIEGPFRIEKIGTVEDASYHIPLRKADRVVPHRIQHTPVDLCLCLGVGRTCGTMP